MNKFEKLMNDLSSAVEDGQHQRLRSILDSHSAEGDFTRSKEYARECRDIKESALTTAVALGHVECVRALLDAGCVGINKIILEYHKSAALDLGIRNGHTESIRAVLTTGTFDADIKNVSRNTTLMFGAIHGRTECIKCLLNAESGLVDINTQNADGNTAFMLGALNGHIECIKCLLNTGLIEINSRNVDGQTAFMLAVMNGHIGCVKYLFDTGSTEDVNTQDIDGNTATMIAVIKAHTECVKFLLGIESVEVNRKDNDGNTALMLAVMYGRTESARLLLETECVDVNSKNENGNTALMLAAVRGRVECMSCLLTAGTLDTNSQNNEGTTALMLAVVNRHLDCARMLLDSGTVDIGIWDNSGNTVHLLEACKGHLERSIQNAEYYVDTSSQANEGILVSRDHIELVRRLLYTGLVDVNTRNDNGSTALLLEASNGHTECIRCLVNNDSVDVNCQDYFGNTALMMAALGGHVECVRCLLDTVSIDVNSQNDNGNTALDMAAERNHSDCIRLLLDSKKVKINEMEVSETSNLVLTASEGDIEWARRLVRDKIIRILPTQLQKCTTIFTLNGHLECLKCMLDSDNSLVAVKDSQNRSLLMLASTNGHTECVKYLMGKDVDVHERGHDNRTALMLAAANGHAECVNILINEGTKVYDYDRDERTALMLAALNGHDACLRCFLHLTVTTDTAPNRAGNNRELGQEKEDSGPAFSTHYYTTTSCIRYRPSITWSRPYVFKSAEQKEMSVLELAICRGFASCAFCFYMGGLVATHDAKRCPYVKKTKHCLFQPAAFWMISDSQDNTDLILAAKNGHFDCVQHLIQYKRIHSHVLLHLLGQHFIMPGRDPHSYFMAKYLRKLIGDERQSDALLRIIQNGSCLEQCVDFLLSGFVCHCNQSGQSALSYALYNKHHACLRLLVEHISDYHKMSCQMPNLFLLGARRLPTNLNYLPIFLNAEIFHWSWYPLFPRRKLRLLARELVIAGYAPGQFEYENKTISPLQHAFRIGDIGLVRYLIANLYMTTHDLKNFQADTNLRVFVDQHGSGELGRLHGQLVGTPWRLEALSLLAVSTSLGDKRRAKDRKKLDPLPEDIEIRLDFMHPLRWLCARQWVRINTNFLFRRSPVIQLDDRISSNGFCCNGNCRVLKQGCS